MKLSFDSTGQLIAAVPDGFRTGPNDPEAANIVEFDDATNSPAIESIRHSSHEVRLVNGVVMWQGAPLKLFPDSEAKTIKRRLSTFADVLVSGKAADSDRDAVLLALLARSGVEPTVKQAVLDAAEIETAVTSPLAKTRTK